MVETVNLEKNAYAPGRRSDTFTRAALRIHPYGDTASAGKAWGSRMRWPVRIVAVKLLYIEDVVEQPLLHS
jgi:hypothetical protein